MAHQFVLGRAGTGDRVRIGHDHCKDCGACLIAGFTAENHGCMARPVDKEVVRIMFDEMKSTAEKSRLLHRAPDGFYEIAGVDA